LKSIWKFSLSYGPRSVVEIPSDAEVLSVQEQAGIIQLWALVDPERPTVERVFSVLGTGWSLDDEPGKYTGTVVVGMFVWHIFEVTG